MLFHDILNSLNNMFIKIIIRKFDNGFLYTSLLGYLLSYLVCYPAGALHNYKL